MPAAQRLSRILLGQAVRLNGDSCGLRAALLRGLRPEERALPSAGSKARKGPWTLPSPAAFFKRRAKTFDRRGVKTDYEAPAPLFAAQPAKNRGLPRCSRRSL